MPETNITIYSNAKRALAEYKTVDEVKDYRDKAVAVEMYAKQAQDFELEYDAALARVRAERKCGELLRDMEMAKPSGNNQYADVEVSTNTTHPKSLPEMGITRDQSSKWQQLANVPDKEFEEAINVQGVKPSTNNILKKTDDLRDEINSIPRVAMRSWGTLIQMERDGIMNTPLIDSYECMTDAMKADTDRLIIILEQWVNDGTLARGKHPP